MKGTVCYWLRCGVAYQQARCAVPLFIFSEICLKSNGSSVVNNLFQCQTTNYMASSSKSPPQFTFPSFSVMLLWTAGRNLLDASQLLRYGHLDGPQAL